MPLYLPCGKCLGCQSKKTNEWALRCTHEAAQYDKNCFITLTYSDEYLPANGGLDHSDFQKFMKRLRKHFTGTKIRYFMCGEYGSLKERPHFHAIIFGIDFEDMELLHTNQKGNILNYTSKTLSKLWPFGFHTIGPVHYGTVKYVAKYSMKRLEENGIDLNGRRPEYRRMSQGIGSEYAKTYRRDIEIHDNIMINGHKNPVPKYYEKFLCPVKLQLMKDNRIKLMAKRPRMFLSDYHILEVMSKKKAKLYENRTYH